MTESIQDTWDKFERWAYRYKRVCERWVEEMFDSGYSDDEGLFLRTEMELHCYSFSDLNISESDCYTRIKSKIGFLRGYLVNISFDGPEFMASHSRFLTLQYPSKCDNAMGVWLEQDLEGEIEAGSYFGFNDFDVSFFCKSLNDVDLASMRSILPFDRMSLRRPKGKAWDGACIAEVLDRLKYDLEFDYQVKIEPDEYESGEILYIGFTWDA
jgi:hypothetical protein